MKKVVALLLALVMVFSMAACAKAPAQDSSTKNPQAEGPAEQSKSNTDTKEWLLFLMSFRNILRVTNSRALQGT